MGLLGSQAWVAKHKPPELFLNFDIFGYGDALWLMSEQADHPAVEAFQTAGRLAHFPVTVSPMREYPPGDHVPFVKAKIPTIGIALIDEPGDPRSSRVTTWPTSRSATHPQDNSHGR